MSMVIIGFGNVGQQLFHTFTKINYSPIQVFWRQDPLHLPSMDIHMSPNQFVSSLEEIKLNARFYFICVPDTRITSVLEQLNGIKLSKHAIIVHTSGTISIKIFNTFRFKNAAVFYPLQTLSKHYIIDMNQVPILITASDNSVQQSLEELGRMISSNVLLCKDELRKKLPVPAVLVNNFVNFLYHLTHKYCEENQIPFDLLFPLMKETLHRVIQGADPKYIQTGPAIRHDESTIDRHIEELKNYPELRSIYILFSKTISNHF